MLHDFEKMEGRKMKEESKKQQCFLSKKNVFLDITVY